MNAKVFKNLIKEAVREAVREEIGVLLLEQKKQELNENKTFSFTSSDIPINSNNEAKSALRNKMGEAFGFKQSTSKLEVINAVNENTGEKINPFAAFIADSAANMTPQDLSGLRNLG
jgi:hypothetical protein